MKVLIACEESQTVCKAFRALGHEAYSCDVQEPSGCHPEWHILGDALEAVKGGEIVTMDGQRHDICNGGQDGRWCRMLICVCLDPLECPAIGSDVSCFRGATIWRR